MENRPILLRGLVCLGLLGGSAALAEEEAVGALGEAATLRVERDGSRFEVRVMPPPDKAVNLAVLRWLADDGSVSTKTEESDAPMDLSDYEIRVSLVKGASAGCSVRFQVKPKAVSLGPGKSWKLRSTSSVMSAIAFPTKGNVDLGLFYGPDNNLSTCQLSTRGPGQMDDAVCYLFSCHNEGPEDDHLGVIINPTNSPATYVGTFGMIYVTLP